MQLCLEHNDHFHNIQKRSEILFRSRIHEIVWIITELDCLELSAPHWVLSSLHFYIAIDCNSLEIQSILQDPRFIKLSVPSVIGAGW